MAHPRRNKWGGWLTQKKQQVHRFDELTVRTIPICTGFKTERVWNVGERIRPGLKTIITFYKIGNFGICISVTYNSYIQRNISELFHWNPEGIQNPGYFIAKNPMDNYFVKNTKNPHQSGDFQLFVDSSWESVIQSRITSPPQNPHPEHLLLLLRFL